VSKPRNSERRQLKEAGNATGPDRTKGPNETDSALLALAQQLDTLVAELTAIQGRSDGRVHACRNGTRPTVNARENSGADISKTEAVLARLYPIELSIMATPARTTADLGVKARHAAYVMSEYWEAPVEQLDWDARTVRLLIEAICSFTGTRLPFRT
jgi:hypothetical protein